MGTTHYSCLSRIHLWISRIHLWISINSFELSTLACHRNQNNNLVRYFSAIKMKSVFWFCILTKSLRYVLCVVKSNTFSKKLHRCGSPTITAACVSRTKLKILNATNFVLKIKFSYKVVIKNNFIINFKQVITWPMFRERTILLTFCKSHV